MHNKQTPLNEVTFENMPQAVAKVCNEVLLMRTQLAEIQQNFQPKEPAQYLTRSETAEMLKVDLSTLFNWQKKGKLVPFGLGNRVYYRRTDIESALILLGKKKGDDNE